MNTSQWTGLRHETPLNDLGGIAGSRGLSIGANGSRGATSLNPAYHATHLTCVDW